MTTLNTKLHWTPGPKLCVISETESQENVLKWKNTTTGGLVLHTTTSDTGRDSLELNSLDGGS